MTPEDMMRELAAIRLQHRLNLRTIAQDEATLRALVRRHGECVIFNAEQMRRNGTNSGIAKIQGLAVLFLAEDPEPLVELATEAIDVSLSPAHGDVPIEASLVQFLRPGATIRRVEENTDGSLIVNLCDGAGFDLPAFAIQKTVKSRVHETRNGSSTVCGAEGIPTTEPKCVTCPDCLSHKREL